MEKNQLLGKITSDADEKLTLARLLDQWERSRSRNIPTATNFLTPQEQRLAEALLRQLGAAQDVSFAGGYAGA